MDRVNLIPDDLILTWKDRLLAVVNRRFLVVLVWVVVVVGGVEASVALRQGWLLTRYTAQASSLETKRATMKAELDNNKAYLAQLDHTEGQLKEQLQRLMQQITSLSAYRERQGELSGLLQELKQAIPYGIWLTELETGAEGQLRIAGGAFEDRLVTQFMAQLKDNPRFTNVAFSFTRKAKIGKTGIVAFEVTCQAVAADRSPS